MEIKPEEIVVILTSLVTGIGGTLGGIKLLGGSGASSSAPEGGDATLRAIERLELKVDSVGRQVGQVKPSVEGLAHEVDEAAHALNELRPVVADLRVRVAGLESRMPSKLQ